MLLPFPVMVATAGLLLVQATVAVAGETVAESGPVLPRPENASEGLLRDTVGVTGSGGSGNGGGVTLSVAPPPPQAASSTESSSPTTARAVW